MGQLRREEKRGKVRTTEGEREKGKARSANGGNREKEKRKQMGEVEMGEDREW